MLAHLFDKDECAVGHDLRREAEGLPVLEVGVVARPRMELLQDVVGVMLCRKETVSFAVMMMMMMMMMLVVSVSGDRGPSSDGAPPGCGRRNAVKNERHWSQ
jgi:hypothetical protein